mmetsp:Transcript_32978/g.29232  ORF Transcript_32978/g.29232 Transcript_32978/m.29232 type:complete len:128 (+) Transcript_32978:93-476(+)
MAASTIVIYGDIIDRYSSIDGMIYTIQAVNIFLLSLASILALFHSCGGFQDKHIQMMFKYLRIEPTAGFILSLAWLTHIIASKEFYDTSINSKYELYAGAVAVSVAVNFVICSAYHTYEIKALFEAV